MRAVIKGDLIQTMKSSVEHAFKLDDPAFLSVCEKIALASCSGLEIRVETYDDDTHLIAEDGLKFRRDKEKWIVSKKDVDNGNENRDK